jgi:hypothetical protein
MITQAEAVLNITMMTRGVLQGAWRSLRKPLVNFLLII